MQLKEIMSIEQKNRLRLLLKKNLMILAVGFGYLIFVMVTKWGIKCPFFLITGKYCPGCGISRMFVALARLDFLTAARYNLLVLCLLPFGLWIWLRHSIAYVKTGTGGSSTAENIFYIIALVLAIAFSIVRNAGWIPFLQMP